MAQWVSYFSFRLAQGTPVIMDGPVAGSPKGLLLPLETAGSVPIWPLICPVSRQCSFNPMADLTISRIIVAFPPLKWNRSLADAIPTGIPQLIMLSSGL